MARYAGGMKVAALVAFGAMGVTAACGSEDPVDIWEGFDERIGALCECFDALGFTSEAECVAVLDVPMAARACINEVYNSKGDWRAVARCTLSAEQQRAECQAGLACDDPGQQVCREEFDAVSAECPMSTGDLDTAIAACF